MKKCLPGFRPVNYKQTGISLLIFGLMCLALKLISYLTGWFSVPDLVLCLGIGLELISLYLIFILSEE